MHDYVAMPAQPLHVLATCTRRLWTRTPLDVAAHVVRLPACTRLKQPTASADALGRTLGFPEMATIGTMRRRCPDVQLFALVACCYQFGDVANESKTSHILRAAAAAAATAATATTTATAAAATATTLLPLLLPPLLLLALCLPYRVTAFAASAATASPRTSHSESAVRVTGHTDAAALCRTCLTARHDRVRKM